MNNKVTVVVNDESSKKSYNADCIDSIRNIDEISLEDEVDTYTDDIIDENEDFDEKDEYIESKKRQKGDKASIDNNSLDFDIIDKVDIEDYNCSSSQFNLETEDARKSRSKFYVQDDENRQSTEFKKFYQNERLLFTLHNVTSFYSSSVLTSNSHKETSVDTIKVKGKLMLTNFQLLFIPNKKHLRVCELDERCLSLFNHEIPLSFVLPLTFIYELKTSNSSHKYRPISNVLENTSTGVIRDLLIKCKNFMTKLFFFTDPAKDFNEIYEFISKLIYHSNYQRVITERFKHLVQDVNASFTHKTLHSTISRSISQDNELEEKNNSLKRKSYLIPAELQQDLVEHECDEYMQVKSGYAVVVPEKFVINTNMPFCVLPKNIADVILQKRVVVNEQNVIEFNYENQTNTRLSTSSPNSRFSMKRASTLVSPRSTKSYYDKSVMVNQQPIVANISQSNPFFDNQFPVWSLTDKHTGCSLILAPDATTANRQDECDILIKNYNALLCDENYKLRNQLDSTQLKVGQSNYNEYEFYKFQVPFDHTDISKMYLRLMEICSFKTKADYIKINESSSFFLRLSNSKWMKRISAIIKLTTKIVNCLHISERNVFLEEMRSNRDCSCIITSLVKMCMYPKYRTIIGFENLIQKDWFLLGHLFNKRMQTPTKQDETSNPETDAQTTPTLLVFLDCVFQLIQQFPNEFEFNEIYLIHMWDYSCSSMSFTYSYDGIISWLSYLNNQTFLAPNLAVDSTVITSQIGKKVQLPKLDDIYLNKIFEINNSFWLDHLKKKENLKLVFNQSYNPKKDLSVLFPNDKMYLLKFWSRCYLRWHEEYHSYKSPELEMACDRLKAEKNLTEVPDIVNRIVHSRLPPPPPTNTNETATNLIRHQSSKITTTTSGIKVRTRTTSDGNIESSF